MLVQSTEHVMADAECTKADAVFYGMATGSVQLHTASRNQCDWGLRCCRDRLKFVILGSVYSG